MNALKGKKVDNYFSNISSNKRQKRLKEKKTFNNNDNNNSYEQNNNKINKTPLYLYTDKKMFLLLKRTFYLNEFEKTERYINSEKFSGKKYNLTKDEFNLLVTEFNNLINLQNLYINIEDLFKSLQLQNKIINILKVYIMNKIEQK